MRLISKLSHWFTAPRNIASLFPVVGLPLFFLLVSGLALTNDRGLMATVQMVDDLIAQVHALDLRTNLSLRDTAERLENIPLMCQGRLTLTSNTPITTSDVTGAGTIYFTPYQGNRIALYDGTKWVFREFTQRSLALGAATANRVYDVFIYDNAGTVTIDTFTIWTNATTRATDLVEQDGVLVKSGATTRRYIGTFYTSAANQTDDSYTRRHLFNYYHRQPRVIKKTENSGADSWTYGAGGGTIRQTNAAAGNAAGYVQGWEETPLFTSSMTVKDEPSNVARYVSGSCIGIDDTTACITDGFRGGGVRNTLRQQLWSESNHHHGVGYHVIDWNEWNTANRSETFYGDDASDGRVMSGFYALVWG